MTDPRTPCRPATAADLPVIAEAHERAFAGFFLARMGRPFLEAYYRLVLDYSGGILLVAEAGDAVLGFVAGFEAPAEFYAYMARSRRRLLLPILRGLLRRPVLIPRALFNRRRVETGVADDAPGLVELSSIAVLPSAAGGGLGGRLVEAFCDHAAARGGSRILLTTDADGNDAVNAFYLRNGFELDGTYMSGSTRRMNRYARSLGEAD